MKSNNPATFFAKQPKTQTKTTLISRDQIEPTRVVSTNSTVGKIWACRSNAHSHDIIFKEFIDGRIGVGKTREENDCIRDILIEEQSLFSSFNHPNLVQIYGVVTEDGERSGKLMGLIMENLEDHKTLYQFALERKTLGLPISSEELTHLFRQYLELLAYLNHFGLSSPVDHFDNLMVSHDLSVKAIDLDNIGEQKFNPAKDIKDAVLIFEPVLELCDDPSLIALFENIESNKITTLDECYQALHLNQEKIYPQQHSIFEEEISHIHTLKTKYDSLVEQRQKAEGNNKEQSVINRVTAAFTNAPEKQDAFNLLKTHGLHLTSKDIIEFINKNPDVNQWKNLSADHVKEYFPLGFFLRFSKMIDATHQDQSSTHKPKQSKQ